MNSLLTALGELKAWQVALLAVIVAATGGAMFAAYSLATGSPSDATAENQQLIPVQRGDLVNDVSINGQLVYANRETLRFKAQGTVEELSVGEGERVDAGQVLAGLDAETIAGLEKAVAQAKINFRNAEDALEEARNPFSERDVAKAKTDVASAEVSLRDAQDALALLLAPSDVAAAQARAAASNAESSLAKAQEALDALLKPSALDLAQAWVAEANAKVALGNAEQALDSILKPSVLELLQTEGAVVSAKLAVQAAKDAYDVATSTPTADELAQAVASLDNASSAMANSRAEFQLALRDSAQKIEASNEALQTASDGYATVLRRWFGVDIIDNNTTGPDTLLTSWGAELSAIFDPRPQLQLLRDFSRGVAKDDPSTPWNEVTVYTWLALYPGTLQAECEGPPVGDTLCIRNELDRAWDTLTAAQDTVDTVTTQGAKAITAAEAAVNSAEKSHLAKVESLAEVQQGLGPLEIEIKKAGLDTATAKLVEAQEALSSLEGEADALDVQAKSQQVALAIANLEKAKDGLSELTDEPDPLVLKVQRFQVALSKANLDKANEDLAALEADADPLLKSIKEAQLALAKATLADEQAALAEMQAPDELDIALKETAVRSSRAGLDAAIAARDGASITAPWAGIVAAVDVEVGQQINRNTPILELVDPTVVEVDGIVDEIDVLFLRVGAAGIVTLEALQDQQLDGTVSEIASTARTQQGVVSYPIRIRVNVPEGIELPEGLSAVAQVIIRETRDGLLIPLQALYGTFDAPEVRLVVNGSTQIRPVVLGISDDFWTVVAEGLVEGDLVSMESQEVATSGFNFRTLRQFGGGGAGRGGFGGAGGGGGGGAGGGRR